MKASGAASGATGRARGPKPAAGADGSTGRRVGKARITSAAPPDASPPKLAAGKVANGKVASGKLAAKPAKAPAVTAVADKVATGRVATGKVAAGKAPTGKATTARAETKPAKSETTISRAGSPAAPHAVPARPAAKTSEVQTLNPPTAQAAKPSASASDMPSETKAGDAKPAESKAAETRPAVPPGPTGRPAPVSRASNKDETFSEGDFVVYPTHGVGRVEKIASEDIAGHKLELIHITFEENRMTLRVPVTKARTAGLRKLASRKLFDEALNVLKGKAKIKRTMWSRRAQEYEAKINSGDPLAIAEVVRDLHRNAGQPDQSFSERQIYEAAMDRLAAELAALDKTDKTAAAVKLADFLKTV